MKTFGRRGIFLTQVVVLLPLIAALSAAAVGITIRVIRFEERVNRQSAEDSTLTDLARRIRIDAGQASEVKLETDAGTTTDSKFESVPNGATLQFPKVTYRFSDRRVTRMEPPGTVPTAVWTFEKADVHVQLESIGGRPRLVWLTFGFRLPTEQGPPIRRSCSMAAAVGEGGEP